MDYTDEGELPWLQPSEVLFGPEKSLAEFFGVTPRTIRTWKQTNRAPLMALRLMRLRWDGDLSALGGKHWHGFRFGRDGLFYHPSYRNGFTPGQLNGWFFRIQMVGPLERENKALTEERDALKAEVESLRAELEQLRAKEWAREKLRGLSVPL